MKLSKEELKLKISEKVTDEDVSIELLEDIEDSFEVTDDNSERITELESELAELKRKYKERFLKGSDEKDETDEPEEDGLEEKEVIDIKEI